MVKSVRDHLTNLPVKVWHTYTSENNNNISITLDITYSYFNATELLESLDIKMSAIDFKRLCKKSPFAHHIATSIEKVRLETGHGEFYPIKAVKGKKIVFFCYIPLLQAFLDNFANKDDSIIIDRGFAQTVVQDTAAIRKLPSFTAFLTRVRKWRLINFEINACYNNNLDDDGIRQYDFEVFLGEYDALHQSKTIQMIDDVACCPVPDEVDETLLQCSSSDTEIYEKLKILFLRKCSFRTEFPNKHPKLISTMTNAPGIPEYDPAKSYSDNTICVNTDGKTQDGDKPSVSGAEYINEYAKFISLTEDKNELLLDNQELKLTIQICEHNIAEQSNRKMTIINDIIKHKYRNVNVIPPDVQAEITQRDSEARKLFAECKKMMDRAEKYQSEKSEMLIRINQEKHNQQNVMQSDRDKYSLEEYDQVKAAIVETMKIVEDYRKEFISLTETKNELIPQEAAAFEEKDKKKVELERLRNPVLSPQKNTLDSATVEANMLLSQVQIRNGYRRDRLNFLDEVDHLKTRAVFSYKREKVDYDLSTLEVRDKMSQYNMTVVAFASEATLKYSEELAERERKRQTLKRGLELLQIEEQKQKAEKARRWSDYEAKKSKYGTLDEIQEEINEAIRQRAEALEELHKAKEEFRNHSSFEVTRARDVRNYWLISLMSLSRHFKINQNETYRWCHHEFRNPTKIDIPRRRDLEMGDLFNKFHKELDIYKDDMCAILLADKPPAVKTTGGGGGQLVGTKMLIPHSSSTIFEEISHQISSLQSKESNGKRVIPLISSPQGSSLNEDRGYGRIV